MGEVAQVDSKIIFYLANYKGLKVLETLIDNFFGNIHAVIIAKDINVREDYSQKMTELCRKHEVCFDFNDSNFTDFRGFRVSVGWRKMLPSEKLIVFHDSLLPKYRGFSPLVNMLINGEKKYGVTGFLATEKYDHGPIFFQKSIVIEYPMRIFDLIKLVSYIYIEGIKFTIPKLISGLRLKTYPQDENNATYSVWRDENDYVIDWYSSSEDIIRFIHAVGFPFLGAVSFLNGKKYYINDAEISEINVTNIHPGKILAFENGNPLVITKTGCIKLNNIVDEDNKNVTTKLKLKTRFRSKKHSGEY